MTYSETDQRLQKTIWGCQNCGRLQELFIYTYIYIHTQKNDKEQRKQKR